MEFKIDTDAIVKQTEVMLQARIASNVQQSVDEYFSDRRVRNYDPNTREQNPFVYEASQAKKFIQGVISDYVLEESTQKQIQALVKAEVDVQVKAMVADVVKHLVRRNNFNKTVDDVKTIAAKEMNK